MSSYYRFLLQSFIDGITNISGIRTTQNYYSRLHNVTIRDCVKKNRVTNEHFQQSPQMIAELQQQKKQTSNDNDNNNNNNKISQFNTKNNKKKSRNVSDDIIIVLEGLKQYSEFLSKNGSRKIKSYQAPLINNNQINIDNNNINNDNYKQKINFQEKEKEENEIDNENKDNYKSIQDIELNSSNSQNITNYNEDIKKPSLKMNNIEKKLKNNSKETKVPSTRTMRAINFGGLAFNLGVGALGEFSKRIIGTSQTKNSSGSISNVLLSEANAEKIVDTLCRVRGAALKLGQMMSIQDSEFLSPEIQAIFERVRQSADYMPIKQMNKVMQQQLGNDWIEKFETFDNVPFAAASIGQVHRGSIKNGKKVAIKIQYPGVAESIESDIKNVLMILKYANVFPDGLFIDHIMNYAKKELSWEVDYIREAKCSKHYRDLVHKYFKSEDKLYVPEIYPELSSSRVLTNEFINGITIDKLDDYRETSCQNVKNSILERLLKLFFMELFQFNYMQTDPNWSNFLYDYNTDRLSLIDFGSCRSYSKEFVDKYYLVLQAAIDNDPDAILKTSLDIGFLSGYEAESFKKAHIESVSIIGEAIRFDGIFDFGQQSVTKRIQALIPVMLEQRLQPPPEEIYSLHRKLSGLFLLCSKMKVQVNCHNLFEQTTMKYKK